jgi:D-glycero-D-manno-heptose 1,7-bisphosphate phosphatase
VLNEVRRGGYVRTREEMEWVPGAAQAVGRLTASGRPLIIITNQSGIARGLYSESDVLGIHVALQEEVGKYGGRLDALYYCPHASADACSCRKPLPGLLCQAADEMNVDMARSVFVGDSETDTLAGRAAGCHVFAVASGMSSAREIEAWRVPPDKAFATLADAVDAILAVVTGSE